MPADREGTVKRTGGSKKPLQTRAPRQGCASVLCRSVILSTSDQVNSGATGDQRLPSQGKQKRFMQEATATQHSSLPGITHIVTGAQSLRYTKTCLIAIMQIGCTSYFLIYAMEREYK